MIAYFGKCNSQNFKVLNLQQKFARMIFFLHIRSKQQKYYYSIIVTNKTTTPITNNE